VNVEACFRAEAGRVIAGLARRIGDLDRAEDAVADAFVLALERWPRDGAPRDPAAWIAVTARNRAIDRIRRDRTGAEKHELLVRLDAAHAPPELEAADTLGDDRLALLFACAHPALERDAQVALTLRTLGGLTTDEIADALFVERTTMQQRLVRAKAKIRRAGIPFHVPPPDRLAERLDTVVSVVYLIFTTGYAPSRRAAVVSLELCASAIAVGSILVRLLPDRAEPHALDALMRFHHARRAARVDAEGEIVLLADQDRGRWDAEEIARASASLKAALALPPCSLTCEAYIAAAHAHAASFETTDWDAIVDAYDALLALHDTPVARCNRAVALAMRGDLGLARTAIDELASDRGMCENRYYHVASAEISERCGDVARARASYAIARRFAGDRDRTVIERRLARLGGA
jgi:RNA polymerase sigma-70 factor (ECF subfamily)